MKMPGFRNTRGMITLLAAAFIIVCSGQPTAAEGAGQPAPAPTTEEMKKIVVARVNGADILMDALVKMQDVVKANRPAAAPPMSEEAARKEALDQLILRELALQEAARQGLSVDPQQLNFAMNNVIKSKGYDQGFQAYLREQNLTRGEVQEQIEKSLLLQQLFKKEVTEKISASASDDELRKEYEQQKHRLKAPEKVAVVDVAIPHERGDPASLKRAGEIRARIMAAKEKDPKNLERDGSFVIEDRELDKTREAALYDAARMLKKGELSEVIETGNRCHILQLINLTPEKQLSFDEVQGPLEELILARKQQQRTREWEKELKKSAKIEIIEAKSGVTKSKDGK